MSDRISASVDESISLKDAVRWCEQHQIDISFGQNGTQSRVRLRRSSQEVSERASFLAAVRDLRRQLPPWELSGEESAEADTRLTHLAYEGRNCRGRILRAANVIDADTVSELLSWASNQPRGIRQIAEFPNVGSRTVEVLILALRNEGFDEIPGVDY